MRATILVVCLAANALAQQDPTLAWIFFSDPAYPQMARIAHISGPVTLDITVQPSGEFTIAKAVGHPILVQAAKDSIQKSKLKCDDCGDEPHTFSIVYEFKIEEPPPAAPRVARVPPVRRQRDRSVRCMYLWRCGQVWIN
jgi:TonB family protein